MTKSILDQMLKKAAKKNSVKEATRLIKTVIDKPGAFDPVRVLVHAEPDRIGLWVVLYAENKNREFFEAKEWFVSPDMAQMVRQQIYDFCFTDLNNVVCKRIEKELRG